MTRWLRPVLPLLLVVLGLPLALLAAPAAVVAGDPCYHGFEIPATTVSTSNEVKAMPCAFEPTIINVPVGTTVTWYSGPGESHLITGANQLWGSRDDVLVANSRVSYTFNEPGIYPYACAFHRGMSGAVVVGDAVAAGGPTSGGAAPAAAPGADAAAADTSTGAGGPNPALVAGAAMVGGLVALGIAWIVRSMRRPVGVKEIG